MLRFVILTICQRSGWCCCDWLYFRPFAREVVHAVVVIFDHLPEKWFMLWLFLTICQRNGSCCGGYFWPFDREVVHVVVVIFDHLPEKWFMLWWLFLTICQRSGSCSCGCFYFVVDNLPELFIYCGWLFLTICKRSGSCCSAISDIIFNLMMAVSIGMTHDFIKTISLKKRQKLVFKSCQYLERF
jgi:hypothetical protein